MISGFTTHRKPAGIRSCSESDVQKAQESCCLTSLQNKTTNIKSTNVTDPEIDSDITLSAFHPSKK